VTTQPRQQRPIFSLRILFALSFLVLCSAALVFQAMTPVARAATTKANASSVSPLIFGTNLQLYGSSDAFLTDSHYVPLLQQIHTQIIRLPTRVGMPESVVKAAAQKVHDMGAAALVILGGQKRANPLADDTPVVQDMNAVFRNSRVYYEFGNEEDLQGVSASQYTDATSTSWNAVISKLKSIANNAFFIGPVNYQYDDAYLRYFLQHANPRPDAVSWHMYTCDTDGIYGPKQSESTCLANLDGWTQHFSDARTAMHTTLGGNIELPIIISEWNYDPHIPQDNGDTNFMNAWTTKALGLLASNHAFASMQYAVDALTPLISNDQLTQQARTFQSEYTQLVGGGSSTPTPTPTLSPTATSTATPTPSPTATPPPTSGFGFEDGTAQGWSTSGNVTAVGSTDYAYVGTHSLEVKFPGTGSDDYPYTSVAGSHLSPAPQSGQILTAYVYVPSSVSLSVSGWLFVQDSNYKWYKESPVTITKGTWNKLTFAVPANANQIGIQFNGTGSGNVYVDEVRWS